MEREPGLSGRRDERCISVFESLPSSLSHLIALFSSAAILQQCQVLTLGQKGFSHILAKSMSMEEMLARDTDQIKRWLKEKGAVLYK